ncbi:hypothetical protein BKA69DRAFT_1040063 [Paraphysoderma sedebokerense]|nr:hypothetical protein BKA69DRAFT_1040063 [Paraphysoderma sedebokerense]
MIKSKQLNINESNIANLGSELEKKARLEGADKETSWKGVGKDVGLSVWRVEQFKVKPIPKNEYGRFYSGDSYIVLNTYKKQDKLAHDLHFWLGEKTTTDEAGTAAYKTVELDDYLHGLPVQHREVQGFESDLFLGYFPVFMVQDGGVDSGFKQVKPETYRPRLLHVKGTMKRLVVREVPMSYTSLNSGDVFIADLGLKIMQFNGKESGPWEKAKAAELCRALDDERRGIPTVEVFEEGGRDLGAFWNAIGGPGPIKSAAEGGDDKLVSNEKKLYRLSDASGQLEFKHEATSPPTKITKAMFDTNDVFIFDCCCEVFVWYGKGATQNERAKGLAAAEEYLVQHNRPRTLPISKVMEGGENEVFESMLR